LDVRIRTIEWSARRVIQRWREHDLPCQQDRDLLHVVGLDLRDPRSPRRVRFRYHPVRRRLLAEPMWVGGPERRPLRLDPDRQSAADPDAPRHFDDRLPGHLRRRCRTRPGRAGAQRRGHHHQR
jgi:hypothetical protein